MDEVIDLGSYAKRKLKELDKLHAHLEEKLKHRIPENQTQWIKGQIAALNWIIGEYTRLRTNEILQKQAQKKPERERSACGDSIRDCQGGHDCNGCAECELR